MLLTFALYHLTVAGKMQVNIHLNIECDDVGHLKYLGGNLGKKLKRILKAF